MNNYPICFFTKLLDKYEPEFMAETAAMAGFDGLDLTVRPGGSVEPENVARDLPERIEAGRKFNLKTEMMASGIRDATDPYAEEVLRVAAENGVKHYRLAYIKYDYNLGIWETLQKVRESFERLANLNQKLGIQGAYQNHQGLDIGAGIWDIWELIRDLPPEWFCCQYDCQHAAFESARSWTTGLRLMSRNIGSIAFKDYIRIFKDGKDGTLFRVPMGEGLMEYDLFFELLKELNIVVPLTLHIEYQLLTEEEEKLPLLEQQKKLVSIFKHDVDFIRSKLKKYALV